jgi:hypothetical protein
MRRILVVDMIRAPGAGRRRTAGRDVQALALEFGAWRVLPAPFDWTVLHRAIADALGRPGASNQAG